MRFLLSDRATDRKEKLGSDLKNKVNKKDKGTEREAWGEKEKEKGREGDKV